MNFDYFTSQIRRIQNTWSEKSFSAEKMTMVWKMVSDLSDDWMRKTVDQLLINSRYAPLPADFQEHIQIEKNKNYTTAVEEKPFNSIFSPDEIKEIMSIVKGAEMGTISKKDADLYADDLRRILKERGVK